MREPNIPRRAVITGAGGFIGGALARRLSDAGAEVVGVDIAPAPGGAHVDAGGASDVADGIRFVAGDITVSGEWEAALEGADLVVHTAALVTNTASRRRAWEVNVAGTRRVVDAAARHGVGRVVHFSSVRVYSDRDFPDGVDETWPVRPDGHAYVDTKVASEQVVLQAHAAGEVPVTVVRPGDVYGPGSRPWTVIPVAAIAKGQFLLPDGGRGIFSPVYVDNLLDGVLAAAGEPRAAGEVFNLTDGIGVTNREFFGHYYRMLGRKPLTAPAPLARAVFAAAGFADRRRGRATEATAEAVDYFLRTGTYRIDKARELLGYEPAVDLAEGMRRTEVWLREVGML